MYIYYIHTAIFFQNCSKIRQVSWKWNKVILAAETLQVNQQHQITEKFSIYFLCTWKKIQIYTNTQQHIYLLENNFYAALEAAIEMAFTSATSQNLCLYNNIFSPGRFT